MTNNLKQREKRKERKKERCGFPAFYIQGMKKKKLLQAETGAAFHLRKDVSDVHDGFYCSVCDTFSAHLRQSSAVASEFHDADIGFLLFAESVDKNPQNTHTKKQVSSKVKPLCFFFYKMKQNQIKSKSISFFQKVLIRILVLGVSLWLFVVIFFCVCVCISSVNTVIPGTYAVLKLSIGVYTSAFGKFFFFFFPFKHVDMFPFKVFVNDFPSLF